MTLALGSELIRSSQEDISARVAAAGQERSTHIVSGKFMHPEYTGLEINLPGPGFTKVEVELCACSVHCVILVCSDAVESSHLH